MLYLSTSPNVERSALLNPFFPGWSSDLLKILMFQSFLHPVLFRWFGILSNANIPNNHSFDCSSHLAIRLDIVKFDHSNTSFIWRRSKCPTSMERLLVSEQIFQQLSFFQPQKHHDLSATMVWSPKMWNSSLVRDQLFRGELGNDIANLVLLLTP